MVLLVLFVLLLVEKSENYCRQTTRRPCGRAKPERDQSQAQPSRALQAVMGVPSTCHVVARVLARIPYTNVRLPFQTVSSLSCTLHGLLFSRLLIDCYHGITHVVSCVDIRPQRKFNDLANSPFDCYPGTAHGRVEILLLQGETSRSLASWNAF